jgi:hypothetical protein
MVCWQTEDEVRRTKFLPLKGPRGTHSDFWMSRAERSFMSMYPKMCWLASFSGMCLPCSELHPSTHAYARTASLFLWSCLAPVATRQRDPLSLDIHMTKHAGNLAEQVMDRWEAPKHKDLLVTLLLGAVHARVQFKMWEETTTLSLSTKTISEVVKEFEHKNRPSPAHSPPPG